MGMTFAKSTSTVSLYSLSNTLAENIKYKDFHKLFHRRTNYLSFLPLVDETTDYACINQHFAIGDTYYWYSDADVGLVCVLEDDGDEKLYYACQSNNSTTITNNFYWTSYEIYDGLLGNLTMDYIISKKGKVNITWDCYNSSGTKITNFSGYDAPLCYAYCGNPNDWNNTKGLIDYDWLNPNLSMTVESKSSSSGDWVYSWKLKNASAESKCDDWTTSYLPTRFSFVFSDIDDRIKKIRVKYKWTWIS